MAQRPESGSSLSRREFVRGLGVAAAAASAAPFVPGGRILAADTPVGPTPKSSAETAVARLYKSLSDDQKKNLCFSFNDPLRKKVGNNWAIVKPRISDLKSDQQEFCREILKGITSEDGYERFTHQMTVDYQGFEQYHIALFGEPGTDKPFEWVCTGRHETLRADGNSVEGCAFGGPIFYGHDATGTGTDDPAHTDNVWWFQGEAANKVFKALDDKQKAQALIAKQPADAPRTVKLKGDHLGQEGIRVGDMDSQQQELVKKLIECMLQPFRDDDVQEARVCIKEAGGLDPLRLTFVKEGDLGNDGTWDIWRLEGPAFSWFFRGSPHVHTWLNVARKASDDPIS